MLTFSAEAVVCESSLDLSGFGAVAEQHKVSAPSTDFLLDLGLETG